MKIALGSDHGGYALKESVKDYVLKLGHRVVDAGTSGTESVNYPEYGFAVGELVANEDCDKGIVFCTSGIGISIAANKVKGVRAALCDNIKLAELARKHNDANVLALGAISVSMDEANSITEIFLNTEFEGGRHTNRVHMLDNYK